MYLYGYLQQKEALQVLSQADYALQLTSEAYAYALSTKIFEYAALWIPCVALNYGGAIDKLVKTNDLGYSVNIKNTNVVDFLRNLSRDPKKTFRYNVNEYSYRYLAKKYSNIINEIADSKRN